MYREEYTDPQFKLAAYLADIDGCEPGDLIMMIVEAAEKSQDGYGYSMSTEAEKFLRQAIDAEIDAHEEWLSGEGKASGIHEDEEIDEALKLIREYKQNRANKLQLDKWASGR